MVYCRLRWILFSPSLFETAWLEMAKILNRDCQTVKKYLKDFGVLCRRWDNSNFEVITEKCLKYIIRKNKHPEYQYYRRKLTIVMMSPWCQILDHVTKYFKLYMWLPLEVSLIIWNCQEVFENWHQCYFFYQ